MLPNYKPINVKLLYCYNCQIRTNHRKDANGNWKCNVCGHVDDDPDENENPAEVAYRLEKSE